MKIKPLKIPDIILIEPEIFRDSRGFFFENYNKNKFKQIVEKELEFVQDNHSGSERGVLRGLHYQLPNPQGKLIRVLVGEIFDVAVDLRKTSPTFTKWVSAILTEDNKHQLWIPEGFAHGFLVLSEYAEVEYKTTQFYSKEDERSISWKDPAISINWPTNVEPLLSSKDRDAPLLSETNYLF